MNIRREGKNLLHYNKSGVSNYLENLRDENSFSLAPKLKEENSSISCHHLIFQILFSFQCWSSVVLLWRRDCAGLPWDRKLYFKNIWKRLVKLETLLSWELSKWLGCQLNCDDPGWEPLTPSFRAEHLLVVLSEMDRVKLKPQLVKIVALKMWASLSLW